MNCSMDRTANAMNVGFACKHDIFDWAAEIIQKPLRRDREQSNRERRLRRDERRRERERVARELHDTLLQGLFGVRLQLQAAVGQVAADAPARAALDRTVDRMRRVIDEGRDILQGLRSCAMESMNLEEALSCLKDEFSSGSGARFRVFVTGQPKALKPGIQEQIYLIGREALINALRHSDATSIEVEVEYRPRRLRVLVRDNGRGIDSKTVRSGRDGHWGLTGMRERAAHIGAQLQIWSRPGAGTEVEISIPGHTLAEAYV